MIERVGDMFAEYLDPGVVYVITTNGYVRNDGAAVMGRGTALAAAQLHGDLPHILGELLLTYGNRPFVLPYGFVTLPVKHKWDEKADLELIGRSLYWLVELLDMYSGNRLIYLPRPGCGNGQLAWDAVRPLVAAHFENDADVTVWSL